MVPFAIGWRAWFGVRPSCCVRASGLLLDIPSALGLGSIRRPKLFELNCFWGFVGLVFYMGGALARLRATLVTVCFWVREVYPDSGAKMGYTTLGCLGRILCLSDPRAAHKLIPPGHISSLIILRGGKALLPTISQEFLCCVCLDNCGAPVRMKDQIRNTILIYSLR